MRAILGLWAILVLAAPAAAGSGAEPGAAPTETRVALLPFTARGAPPECWDRLRPDLEHEFAARGLEVVPEGRVREELRARRLRDLSLLTREEIRGLSAALGAGRMVIGALYRCAPAGEAASLAARVLDPARLGIERLTFIHVGARDFLGPLGTGGPVRPERTLAEAARRLAVALFPKDEKDRDLAREWSLTKRSVLAPTPALFLSPRLRATPPDRVVVLPFRNRSDQPHAGQVAAELTACALAAALPVELYDGGDATRRLLERGWRTGLPVGREEVTSLAGDPGVDAVLMGDVDFWDEGSVAGGRPPELAVSFRLLDAATGDILWAAEHERRGDETRSFYEAGNVRLPEILMLRAACEALAPLARTPVASSTRPTQKERSHDR